MKYAWYDFVGNVGVVLMILCYLLLQMGKLRLEDPRYSALNAIGAVMVLVSLYFSFNLSAFIVEGFWLAISLFGLIKLALRSGVATE
jgi:hypothetical protein